MAAEMRARGEKVEVHSYCTGRWSYVLLPIDFGKPKKHALKMLAVLLEESQSKERFEKYSKKPFGEAKDRLKDLATWRLYRHCGNDWNKANDFADAHRKKTKKGVARPFYSAQQKQEEDSITGAPLAASNPVFLKQSNG